MANVSSDMHRDKKSGREVRVPMAVKGNVRIFTGAIALAEGTGRATDVLFSGYVCMGVASQGYDNTGGPDGVLGTTAERYCIVDTAEVEWAFPISGAAVDTGDPVYVEDTGTLRGAPGTEGVRFGTATQPHPSKPGWWFVRYENQSR